jgi:transcription-repair coupling factor (superfamily II helicase)
LQAIEEFAELGSGFNLAMRDLELRGTGNLLGAEQSGFILEMGFEMYERIVRETVEELKQEEFSELFNPPPAERRPAAAGTEKVQEAPAPPPEILPVQDVIVDADVDAFIPEFYVESPTERLDFYRRLYRLTDRKLIDDMRTELEDRFGEYPEEVEHLFNMVDLKLLAGEIGFPRVEIRPGALALALPEEAREDFYGIDYDPSSPFQKLMGKIAASKGKGLRLQPEGKIVKLVVAMSSGVKQSVRLSEALQKMLEIKEWMKKA